MHIAGLQTHEEQHQQYQSGLQYMADIFAFKQSNEKVLQQQSFEDMRLHPNSLFVDKSEFIKDVLCCKDSIINLNRPPKWGKSLNLQMLQKFLAYSKNQQVQKFNKMFFMGGQVYNMKLDSLLIYKNYQKLFNQNYGSFLVLTLDLQNINQLNPKFIKVSVIKLIVKEFKKIMHSNQINNCKQLENILLQIQNQIQQFQLLLSSINKFIEALQALCNNNKIFLLIDNFSSPVQRMLFGNCPQIQIQQLSNFLAQFCISFVHEKQKRKVVLFGTINILTNVSKEIQVYDLTCNKFSEHFGFTIEEISQQMLPTIKILGNKQKNKQKIKRVMKDYYNGYLVKTAQKKSKSIYHPFGIYKYLKDCVRNKQILVGQIYNIYHEYQNFFSFIVSKSYERLEHTFTLIQLASNSKTENNKFQFFLSYSINTKNILLQILKNQNNEDQKHLKDYISYLLVCFGIVSGTVFNSCKSIQIYIPNKFMLQILQTKIKKTMEESDLNHDFEKINIINKKEFKQKIQSAMVDWQPKLPSINELNYSIMVYMRCVLSKNFNHRIYIQQHCSNGQKTGKFDQCYYPFKGVRKALIHQYKIQTQIQNWKLNDYKNNPKSIKVIHRQNYLQIITNGYLDWLIYKSQTQVEQQKIKGIIIRSIIFLNKHNIKTLQIAQYEFSIQNAIKISAFFKLQKIKKLIENNNQKSLYYLQSDILKICRQDTLIYLFEQIENFQLEQIKHYFAYKSKIDLDFTSFNFSLFMVDYPLLRKVKFEKFDIQKLFSYKAVQWRDISDRMSVNQSELLCNQLQNVKNLEKYIIPQNLNKKVKRSYLQQQQAKQQMQERKFEQNEQKQ